MWGIGATWAPKWGIGATWDPDHRLRKAERQANVTHIYLFIFCSFYVHFKVGMGEVIECISCGSLLETGPVGFS